MHKRFFTIPLIAFTLVLSTVAFVTSVHAQAVHDLWGWAWSENIGWISFSSATGGGGGPYDVQIDRTGPTSGTFSGYAWSDRIGWISFNRGETGTPPGAPYNASETYTAAVNFVSNTGTVDGWARALANGGGWDGWIKLRKDPSDSGSSYGITLDGPSGIFTGWAWGGDVVGWISFNSVTDGSPIAYSVQTTWNTPPTLSSISDKTATEGVELTVPITATDIDANDTLTYSHSFTITPPNGDTAVVNKIDNNNAELKWTPGFNDGNPTEQTHPVTITVDDGSGGTDQKSFTVTVSNVNSAPVLDTIGNKSVDEAALLSFTVYATDEEDDQAGVTITKAGNGNFINATTWDGGLGKWKRTYEWTPTYTDAGSPKVTFTATDRKSATDSEQITITVNNINRAPAINTINDEQVIEGQMVSFNVVINDLDIDDTLNITYSVTQGKDPAMVFVETTYTESDTECVGIPSGSGIEEDDLVCTIPFSWPTDYFDAGVYNLTFKAEDLEPTSNTESMVITVIDTTPLLTISVVATQPVGQPIPPNPDEEEQISYLVTATSEDQDDVLDFQMDSVSAPEGPFDRNDTAYCFINGGNQLQCAYTFTWTPNICFAGPNGNSEDETKTFEIFELSGSSATISKNETVTVDDKNRAPGFTSPTTSGLTKKYTVNENDTLSFSVSASDLDATQCLDNTLVYFCTELLEGSNRCTNNSFSWTPSFNAFDNGPVYTFNYYVDDGTGASNSSDWIEIEITVVDVNRAPIITGIPDNNSAIENVAVIDPTTSLAYDMSDYSSDPDGDVLAYSINSGPGAINSSSGIYTWTALYTDGGYPNEYQNYSVTIKVDDDGSTPPVLSDTDVFNVRVHDKNRQPSMNSIAAQNVLENTQLSFAVTTGDSDSDNTLTHSITTPSGNHPGAAIPSPTTTTPFPPVTVQWTPGYTFITDIENVTSQTTSMTILVADGSFQPQTLSGGAIATRSGQVGGGINGITVFDANQAPSYTDTISFKQIDENQTLTFSFTVSDQDGDDVPIPNTWLTLQSGASAPSNISYPNSQQTSGGYPNVTTLEFQWTPDDTQGGVNPTTCYIDYNLRVFSKDDISARDRGSSAATCPTPTLTLNKSCQIQKDFTVRVTNVNQPPVFTGATISDGSTDEQVQFYMDIDATDPDPGDTLTYSIVDADLVIKDAQGNTVTNQSIYFNNQAVIDSNDGEFRWTPDWVQAGVVEELPSGSRSYWQEYTFTIKVVDDFAIACGTASSDTATFTVRVDDINRVPVLGDDTSGAITIVEQATTSNSFNSLNSDLDTDNTFVYTYTPVPALPLVDTDTGIRFDGVQSTSVTTTAKTIPFVWTPTLNQAYYNAAGTALQPYTITFEADDQRDVPYSDTHNVLVTIVDVNRAPIFDMSGNPTPQSMNENATLDIVIKAIDNDADYINNKVDSINFSLTGYTLIPQEIPLDDSSISFVPLQADLLIDGVAIPDPQVTALIASGTPIDLGVLGSPNCQIKSSGLAQYRECTQTFQVDLVNQFHHMGQHNFTFTATDIRYGDDPTRSEDNPKSASYALSVLAGNVNRAPDVPTLNSPPDDPNCYLSVGCDNHNLELEPLYDPSNLVFTFTPAGDLDSWSHQDTVTYSVYIKELPSGSFVNQGSITLSALDITEQSITVTTLNPATEYEWYIEARDDAPDRAPTGDFTDSIHWRFKTAAVNCTDGSECRKGEVCYDDEGDGSPFTGAKFLCVNFEKCDITNAACFLSVCDPLGGNCYSSPSNRVFTTAPGVCRPDIGNTCDLPAAIPNTPSVCDSDGSNCSAVQTSAKTRPRLTWIDSDPPESFTDYRPQEVSYPGNNTRHTVTLTHQQSLAVTSYNWSDSNDLSYQLPVSRYLDFTTLNAVYLDFDTTYNWQVISDTQDSNPDVPGPDWQFTTESICPYIDHDYNPQLYLDTRDYPVPTNVPDNPNVVYPLDVTLSWSSSKGAPEFEGVGTLSGNPEYILYIQEDNLGVWQPFPGLGTCGSWGCVTLGDTTSYTFGGANPSPQKDTKYRWRLDVLHGHSATVITGVCNSDPPPDGNGLRTGDVHYFTSEDFTTLSVTKTLVSVRDTEVTYQINFSFSGPPWARVGEFYVRDTYPDNSGTAFADMLNLNPSDRSVLVSKQPSTLQIKPIGAPASVGCPGPGGGIQEIPGSQITWCLEDTSEPDGSVSVSATGSILLTLEEQTAQTFPQCTFLTNSALAGGLDASAALLTSPSANSESYLAGSGQLDGGFVSTQSGDVHSNLDICFLNAPASGFYVSDYFITAKGDINESGGGQPSDLSRRGSSESPLYVQSGNPIFEIDKAPGAPGFAAVDYTDINALASSPTGTTVSGECQAADLRALFGGVGQGSPLRLAGLVFRCSVGSGTDRNGDGISNNGDLIINEELFIDDATGAGTIIVDGNLFINQEMRFAGTSVSDVGQIASLGWIVRGDVVIKEYPITLPADCGTTPVPAKWCTKYGLVNPGIDLIIGTSDDYLEYGQMNVGPENIVGTFFSEGTIYTGRNNVPLKIEGSLIADEVVLERVEFPQ